MSLFSIEVFELNRLNATRVHQGNICECVKMWKEGRHILEENQELKEPKWA